MKKVIFTTVGNISPEDKANLAGIGVLVIEAKDISKIKYESEIDNSILLDASMAAIDTSLISVTKNDFFRHLYKIMKDRGQVKNS